jgi:hypothetical protein
MLFAASITVQIIPFASLLLLPWQDVDQGRPILWPFASLGSSDIVLETKQKTFWCRSRICLLENRLLRYVPESALLDQIEIISFDAADSSTNSDIRVSFLLASGTFVERLFLYCFDITTRKNSK